MKLFKKMFGTKPKQISKYESNTLADLNESPDRRKAEDEQLEATVSSASTTTPTSKARAAVKSNSTKVNQTTLKVAESGAKAGNSTTTKATKTTGNNTAKSTKATTETERKEAEKTTAKATVKRATRTVSTIRVKKAEALDNEHKSKSELSNTDDRIESAKNEGAITDTENSTNSDTNDGSVEAVKAVRSGRFEIKKSKDGRFVFNLYASNSVIVATSQVYSSSTAAMNGIKSVIANASTAQIEDQTLKTVTTVSFPKWEIYRDKSEHYRFRLCASNGSCVCHSQGYTSKTNCKKGIESIIKFAPGAEITKTYLNKDK